MSTKPLTQFSSINSALKCIQQIGQNEEKITDGWRFQSILKTFGIKTQMMNSQKHKNEKHTYESYKSLNNKIAIK